MSPAATTRTTIRICTRISNSLLTKQNQKPDSPQAVRLCLVHGVVFRGKRGSGELLIQRARPANFAVDGRNADADSSIADIVEVTLFGKQLHQRCGV